MRNSAVMFAPGTPSSRENRENREERVERLTHDISCQWNKQADWSHARREAHRIVTSKYFDASMSLLIVLNMIFVIVEVNLNAEEIPAPAWLVACNALVLTAYFLEACLKVFTFRKGFLSDPVLLIDMAIVAVDIIVSTIVAVLPVSIAPVVLARIARILKISRVLRLVNLFPELGVMVKGIFFASKTVFWGVVFLGVTLCFWSIFATLFIHPIVKDLEREGYWASLDCDRCPRAFASVERSMLTFCQQLIVGEGWSEINTPLIEKRPDTVIFFMAVMVSLTLAALNLLLGLIVERAAEAKSVSAREESEEKHKLREQATKGLLEVCVRMDADGSGRLELEEIKRGYEQEPEFAHLLTAMDIEERDLDIVFSMLDADGSGDVEYTEFVDQLYMLKSQESNTLLCFIKFYVMEILATVNRLNSQNGPVRKARSTLAPASMDTADAKAPEPRMGSLISSPPAAAAAAWPEFQAELQKLSELQREVNSFSKAQVEELDRVQRRLVQAFQEAAPAKGCNDTSGDNAPIEDDQEASPTVLAKAAPGLRAGAQTNAPATDGGGSAVRNAVPGEGAALEGGDGVDGDGRAEPKGEWETVSEDPYMMNI